MIFLNTINFRNTFNHTPIQKQNQGVFLNIFAPKLAPLKKDTISFKGIYEYKTAINNLEECKQVYQEAQGTAQTFKKYLKNGLQSPETVGTGEFEFVKGIKTVKTRIKTPDSIAEKVADRFEIATKSGKDFSSKIFNPNDVNSIKATIRDIIGARIVMQDVDTGSNARDILKALGRTIKKHNLIVDEVENHKSNNPNVKDYFSEKELNEFLETVNEVRQKNGLDKIEIINNSMESGYMALHLNFDLRSKGKLEKNRGYYAELQILGADIEMLKDIEDYCYKLKQGKSIKSGDITYKPFSEIFNTCLKGADSAEHKQLVKVFGEYTKFAYNAQRNKLPSSTDGKNGEPYKFPTLKQFYKYQREKGIRVIELNPLLDFNILSKIHEACEQLYTTKNEASKILTKMFPEEV